MKNASRFTMGAIAALFLTASPALAYEAADVKDGGSLSGTITGGPGKAGTLKVTKNDDVCGKTVPDESGKVKDNKIEGAVVTIQGITKGKKADTKPAVLDNAQCVFVPHVQAAMVGSKIDIKNSDPILHNSHAYIGGKITTFNVALPNKGQKVTKDLKKAGIMDVKCDAGHTWMKAWIVVHDSPYYAMTDAKGSFKIDNIPPGKYKVKVWHEALGETEKEVTIAAKAAAKLDAALKK